MGTLPVDQPASPTSPYPPESETIMSPVRIRPAGGGAGCLVMILVSIVLSVGLTLVLNLFAR